MTTLKCGIAITGLTLMATTTQASQTNQMSLVINKELVEHTLFITPYAISDLSGSFTYQLKVEKKGKSGTATNQQSGQVLLIPGIVRNGLWLSVRRRIEFTVELIAWERCFSQYQIALP